MKKMFFVLDNTISSSYLKNVVMVTEDKNAADDFVNEYSEYLDRWSKRMKIKHDLLLIKNKIPVPVKNTVGVGIIEQVDKLQKQYSSFDLINYDTLLKVEKMKDESELIYKTEHVRYNEQCAAAVEEYFEKNPDTRIIMESEEPERPYHKYVIIPVDVLTKGEYV